MSGRLKKHFHELNVLKNCTKCQRNNYIEKGSRELIYCLCDICHNILNGNIPISKTQSIKLRKYKRHLRFLSTKNKNNISQKRKVIQEGGFLPILLEPILAIATGLVVDLIENEIRK